VVDHRAELVRRDAGRQAAQRDLDVGAFGQIGGP
jgi:hypothetical protein